MIRPATKSACMWIRPRSWIARSRPATRSRSKSRTRFRPNDNGEQQNECRDLILAYLEKSSEKRGRDVAKRLQAVTTKRSGLGLLFVMAGQERAMQRLVISRFPADSGILAEQKSGSLNVEFLERIFMKSATSYKSAVYVGVSSESDFWDGKAVDKQINNQRVALSDYWIKDFLLSDFKTTGAAGTRRLASALRAVAKKTARIEVKEQIAAAARLSTGFGGRRTSIADFAKQLQLSDAVKDEIRAELPSERLYTDKFQFDAAEFQRHLTYLHRTSYRSDINRPGD